jgi:hypothetical protein
MSSLVATSILIVTRARYPHAPPRQLDLEQGDLLFIWLISAAGGAWLTGRKGYGERLGLMFGLVLSAVGLILALVLPGRPGSKWKREGPFPRRRRVTGR